MTEEIQRLIPRLYALVAQLERAAPGRSFTPDGHLLGSIGEVIAASRYGLRLTTASTKGIDAYDPSGRPVEIKTTGGGGSIAVRDDRPVTPDLHLLVLTIGREARRQRSTTGRQRPSGRPQGVSSRMVRGGSASPS